MPHNKLVHLNIAPALLAEIDRHAKAAHTTRAEFIRQASVEKIRSLSTSASEVLPTQPVLLMTDRQLDDFGKALLVERRRRREAKRHDRNNFYQ